MQALTKRQSEVLDFIDEKIEELEERLAKARPLMDELDRLRATRRTLLAEKRTTSGSGNSRVTATMEEVIHHIRTNGPSTSQEIADSIGAKPNTVRAMMNRNRDVRFDQDENNRWSLIGVDAEGVDDGGEGIVE